MKERTDSERNYGDVDVLKFKFSGIPIGRLLESSTNLSEDQKTREGLNKASKALKKGGLIILDTHHARFDVLATGINILRQLNIDRCIIPSSIKNLNNPLLKDFYEGLNKIKGLELFPTYRKAEYVSEDEKKMYENMNEEERLDKNNEYIVRATEILKEPKSIVFLAVYGGFNRPYGGTIPHGVEKILKTGNPAICTLSVYGKRFLPITTYLSNDLISFDKNSQNSDMYKTITKEHKRIAERVGFSKDYFEYKNNNAIK